MTIRAACLAVVLGAPPSAAWAQVLAGPEFRVNAYTAFDEFGPSVASDPSGNFVVAWESMGQDGSGRGVYGQRFSAAGTPLGAEFRINTFTTNHQENPDIASHANGNFVVVWHSYGQDGSLGGIFGQRFSAEGTALGAEFRVNSFTTGAQVLASVASDANGHFVVAWAGHGQEGTLDIYGQRFSAAGAPRGTEFRINTYTESLQNFPSVASDASGNFVVAWLSFYQDGSSLGIFGQRFDAAGTRRGTEFRINTFTTGLQTVPAVAMHESGLFVVVWMAGSQDGHGFGVFGQRFSAAGAALGTEFQINTYTTRSQYTPSIAVDATGNFVVAWSSDAQDGSYRGVFGQRLSAAGAPVGAEFRINTFTTSFQENPSIASDASGNFVVAWSGFGPDGMASRSVFGQRFGGLHPAALAVDTAAGPANGNGVLEPGELTDARPSWRNVNGAAQAFGGVFSGIAGPPGAQYSVSDPDGDYGTVTDGATQACVDCYGIGVSVPAMRPVLHWDARVLETIGGAHGQSKRWRLHIGDSFIDVPRTNPFYRFVETLLHHGVTGGCSATQFCPGSAITREHTAAFVLVAREKPGYEPPACVPPNVFNDVPEASPLCRWIEELARRGVVGGCAPGLFCPANAVTREQMSVFVLRTLDPALDPPACAPPNIFDDVPETSAFCRWIEELANRGVVIGCGANPPLYCPSAPVTREQMGVFIGATFGLLLYGP